ncbi:MAG TPA: YihY/virulence factor BrkB family protein [Anaerolineales bacterium]|jgi:membrane protein
MKKPSLDKPEPAENRSLLWHSRSHLAKGLDDYSAGWLGVLVNAAGKALDPRSAITSAAIAYFALLSLFPIALLGISIASFGLGPWMDQQIILQRLEFIAPALSQLLGNNLNEIIKTRGPVSGLALVGLVWSASTIFYMLTQTLNDIWAYKYSRPVWKRRGLAIVLVLTLVGPALFLASFAGSVMGSLVLRLPTHVTPLVGALSFIVATLLNVALFMLLYALLPHGASSWREILPGAIAAGLVWELAKKAFLLFVTFYVSMSNLVYGSVSAIIAFLVWAYLSGHIFLFGAYLNLAYHQIRLQQKEASGGTEISP